MIATAGPGAAAENPSAAELGRAQAAVSQGAQRVADLANQVTSRQARLNEVELTMGGMREAVNKALVDLHDAQAIAERARQGVIGARESLEGSQADLARAQGHLDELARSAYRRGASAPSALSGGDSARDAIDRRTFLRLGADEQREILARLDLTRTENANRESLLRRARDEAEARVAEAGDAERRARAELDRTMAELSSLSAERDRLLGLRERAEDALAAARGTAEDLAGRRDEAAAEDRREAARAAARRAEGSEDVAEEVAESQPDHTRLENPYPESVEAGAVDVADIQNPAGGSSAGADAADAVARVTETATETATEFSTVMETEVETERSTVRETATETATATATHHATAVVTETVKAEPTEGAGADAETTPATTPSATATATPTATATATPSATATATASASATASAPASSSTSTSTSSSTPTTSTTAPSGGATAQQRIETVIARAKSQLGVPYSWGGGNAHGPTRGIRDGGVADAHGDYAKVGFDCSGLVLYAFAGVGISLPHYTGYQYQRGRKISPSQIRRGDLVFWGPNAENHVALYLGDGMMIEAPHSGAHVRIAPIRWGGMSPYAVRLIE